MNKCWNYLTTTLILFAILTCVCTSFLAMCGEKGPRRIVLIYVQAREGFLDWTVEKFIPLVAFVSRTGEVKDVFFDGFLFLGVSAPGGRRFWDDTGVRSADFTDWAWFHYQLFKVGGALDALNSACRIVSDKLKRDVKVYVIVMIPYPSPKLSFKERASMCEAWIKWVLKSWDKDRFDHLRFEGFYWLKETISPRDIDLIKHCARLIHENNLKFYLIPYFTACYYNWREVGFDVVTVQSNFAFYDVGEERFRYVTARVSMLGLQGVEMELPRYKRNPRLADWKDSFKHYLKAFITYQWYKYEVLTFYHGLDFYRDFKEDYEYYEAVYRVVKGDVEFLEAFLSGLGATSASEEPSETSTSPIADLEGIAMAFLCILLVVEGILVAVYAAVCLSEKIKGTRSRRR